MGAFFKKLEELLGGGPGGNKRLQTFRWLIIIGLVGLALMILNSFNFLHIKNVDPGGAVSGLPPDGENKQAAAGTGAKDKSLFRDYEQAYESQLKELLSKIVGVGDVEVMVTIDSTEEITVEKNSKDTQQVTNEKDTNGATRSVTDVTRSGDAVVMQNQNPLILKTTKPKIRGVVVVAKGAENLTVKKLISDAVVKGLDVPVNKISVVPRKQ